MFRYSHMSPRYIPNECWVIGMRLPQYMDHGCCLTVSKLAVNVQDKY